VFSVFNFRINLKT